MVLNYLWLLLFSLLCVALFPLESMGLQYFGAPPPFNVPPLSVAPTLLTRMQYGGNVDFYRFQQNYTVVLPADGVGCDLSNTPRLQPSQLLWVNTNGPICEFSALQRNAQDHGAAGAFGGHALGSIAALFVNAVDVYPRGIPLFWAQSSDPASTPVPLIVPTSLILKKWLSDGLNITVFLSFPEPNPIYVSLSTTGGGAQVSQAFGIAFSLVTMGLATVKGSIVIFLRGKIQFTVPQITIGFCMLTGFFSFFNSINGWIGTTLYSDGEACQFFENFGWSCVLSAALVLGLYFREVSMISNPTPDPVLSRFKIPCAVLLTIQWLATIAIGALNVAEPPNPTATASFGEFFMSWVVIACAGMTFILGWGVVSIFRVAIRVKLILPIPIFSVLTIVLINGCAISFYALRFFPTRTSNLSVLGTFSFYIIMNSVAPCLVAINILLIFRIRVAKEIELSVSATTTTLPPPSDISLATVVEPDSQTGIDTVI